MWKADTLSMPVPPNDFRFKNGPMLVVDGNSLLHRNYHALAATNMRIGSGAPSWAFHGMWNQMIQLIHRVGASSILIGFDDTTNLRTNDYPEYKAGRAEKPNDLRLQLAAAPKHFSKAGIPVVTVPGYEADDVIASTARRNSETGVNTVIASSDRDAFSLITDNMNGTSVTVLRVINGGIVNSPLLTAGRLPILCGVTPNQYRLYAALRGDKSDNLPGVTGIGEKTAVALLKGLSTLNVTLQQMLTDLDDGGTQLSDLIGMSAARKFDNPISRTNLTRNLNLMKQHDTLDVGILDDTLLPFNSDRLREELQVWEMRNILPRALDAFANHNYASTPENLALPATLF